MTKKGLSLAIAASILAQLVACNALLPPHANSDFRKDEHVSLQLLADDEFDETLKCRFKAAFGKTIEEYREDSDRDPTSGDDAQPKIVDAAAAVAGLVVDTVAKQLDKEANRYEAQFGATIAVENFYKNEQGSELTHYGFEMTRRTTRDDDDFRLVFGIAPSDDGHFFRVAPLLLQVRRAKAKVVTDDWWSYFNFLWKWAWGAGHHLRINVDLSIRSLWRDRNGKYHNEVTADFSFKIPSYDLNRNAAPIVFGEALDASGWFGAVPRSAPVGEGGKAGKGTLQIDIKVTESDPSNVADLLIRAKGILEDNRGKLIDSIARSGSGET